MAHIDDPAYRCWLTSMESAQALREAYERGEGTYKELAARWGVSQTTAITGRTWGKEVADA